MTDEAQEQGPEAHGTRPMPIPGRPETYHGGTAAEAIQRDTGHKPMPRPRGPRPLTPVHHDS
ncbi:MAG TPA: hypothetical protein VMB05_14580 [Solirubrobacteraceae bacterium]|nr:hypothetical protein [Solirubrobacteraceae bacterium]